MNDWIQYISELTGEKIDLSPDLGAVDHLPVFIGSAYEIFHGKILDQPVRFFVPKRPAMPVLPDLLRDYSVAGKNLDGEVVFVLDMAPPHIVRRLVRERIPFIVPRRQIFLPGRFVSLRTNSNENSFHVEGNNVLSARAQILLLYHLQKQSLSGQSQVEVARRLKWTAMTVSRCIQEFQSKNFCCTLGFGRSKIISLDRGREFWDRVEQFLRSPVTASRFVRIPDSDVRSGFHAAGLPALSRYSMLNEDSVAVIAIHKRLFRELVERKRLEILPYMDEGCSVAELWSYDPGYLSEGGVVDRLSLYLSLRGNPDERVQSALKELLEGIKW